jgi:O-antigen/teichoic acid export membrane protein
MNALLSGGIATASIIAGVFFLRYWRSSRDRFFLYFAASFFIEGVNRFILYLMVGLQEEAPVYYLIRLVAYGLIVLAIVAKNRERRVPPPPASSVLRP